MMAEDRTPNVVDVDGYLQMAGEFGKMQIIFQVMFCLLVFASSLQILLVVFAGNNPPWKCTGLNSECNDTNIAYDVRDNKYEMRCQLKNRSSWEFTTPKKFSIVTEWDLVCNKKVLLHLATSAFFIGRSAGILGVGYISDRFGRKKVLFPSMAMVIICGFVSAFVQNFWQFFTLRCINGIAQIGVLVTTFTLAVELVGPRYRVLSGSIIWFAYTISFSMMAFQAWLVPDWRILEMILSAPYAFVLVFWMFMPESIRWLRINGKVDKAEKILKKIAKVNGRPIPNVRLSLEEKATSKKTLLDLFRPYSRCKNTLILCFVWFVNGLIFFGLPIAADDLSGNIYRDFILITLMEIPADILAIAVGNRFGRRPVTVLAMIATGLACFGVAAVPNGTNSSAYNWLRVTLAMFGRFDVEISYTQTYVWSAEMFPTAVRSQGIGLVNILTAFGGCASPWVAQFLRHTHATVPFTVMGILAIISAIVRLLLPETKGKATAEVMETDQQIPEFSGVPRSSQDSDTDVST